MNDEAKTPQQAYAEALSMVVDRSAFAEQFLRSINVDPHPDLSRLEYGTNNVPPRPFLKKKRLS